MKLTILLHSAPKLRMSRGLFCYPICLHGSSKGNLTLRVSLICYFSNEETQGDKVMKVIQERENGKRGGGRRMKI